MPEAYVPLLLFALLVMAFPAAALLAFRFVGRKASSSRPRSEEGDWAAEAHVAGRSATRLFVVPVLFVIFDVAMVFLFSWAILYRTWLAGHAGGLALTVICVFLGILSVGYVWLYKKGALDWT
jgi:NADH-quinone oxidoreductase subunit A